MQYQHLRLISDEAYTKGLKLLFPVFLSLNFWMLISSLKGYYSMFDSLKCFVMKKRGIFTTSTQVLKSDYAPGYNV